MQSEKRFAGMYRLRSALDQSLQRKSIIASRWRISRFTGRDKWVVAQACGSDHWPIGKPWCGGVLSISTPLEGCLKLGPTTL